MAFEVLVVLAAGANHGYGIAKEIEYNSEGRTRPGTGSLYLSMSKLKDGGLIDSCGPPEGLRREDSRRRYYCLTNHGRAVAAQESRRLLRLLQLARQRDLIDDSASAPLINHAAESGA